MKKADPPGKSDKRRRHLTVVCAEGVRQRFLRGMITHDLVQRGLDFDQAFATASAIRDELGGRDEVTTSEIRDLIREHLERELGGDLPPDLADPLRPVAERYVIYQGRKAPFSRGVLAASIYALGIEVDHAYRLIKELEESLEAEGIGELTNDELGRRVGDLLERIEGVNTARRYRMVRRLHRLPRPLVIYVGGASGTGKSTLSLALAPLLRIYRINATDSIRQVMRMVFSPEIMPSLYTSSFEPAPPYGPWPVEDPPNPADPESAESLIANFEEQARRVTVGVRAVVERAIAENISVLVEGVHLYPPLVPFPDLEGAVYQIPLILTTPEAEVHRTRFLTRGRPGRRRAERYLRSFPSIRLIHEYLLQQADTHDVALLSTSYAEPPAAAALRLVTSLLAKKLPQIASSDATGEGEVVPVLLLIIDGLPDRPVRTLGGRTPLEAARTPHLNRLAREGRCGLADPVAPGVVPDTAAGTLALFGQSPLAMNRGPVEALGAGVKLRAGDVALRGNFATLDDGGHVIDRRAGRIRDETRVLARALDRLPLPGMTDEVEVRVKEATEHRLAIVLRGDGLSAAILGSDPGESAAPGPPLTPRPEDPHDERAVFTAAALNLFENEAREVLRKHPVNKARARDGLPRANALLTRGAGAVHRLVPLEESGMPLRMACVAGDCTILGLAEWMGADLISKKSMTANLDTDLEAKFKAAAKALATHDLVIVHVKGADIAAHDRRPDLKAEFIEKVDGSLGRLLDRHEGDLRIAVAADHATLSESGQHAADPMPTLIWGSGIEADEVTEFTESAAATGALQRFPLQLLLSRLFNFH